MGAWFFGLPSSPLLVLCPASPRQGGPSDWGFWDVHASRRNALVPRGVVPVVPAWWASHPRAWEHFGVAGCASSCH